MKKETSKYVLGWNGENQCVYGKASEGNLNWVDPLTLKQAQRLVKKFPKSRAKIMLYKLVPVNPL